MGLNNIKRLKIPLKKNILAMRGGFAQISHCHVLHFQCISINGALPQYNCKTCQRKCLGFCPVSVFRINKFSLLAISFCPSTQNPDRDLIYGPLGASTAFARLTYAKPYSQSILCSTCSEFTDLLIIFDHSLDCTDCTYGLANESN